MTQGHSLPNQSGSAFDGVARMSRLSLAGTCMRKRARCREHVSILSASNEAHVKADNLTTAFRTTGCDAASMFSLATIFNIVFCRWRSYVSTQLAFQLVTRCRRSQCALNQRADWTRSRHSTARPPGRALTMWLRTRWKALPDSQQRDKWIGVYPRAREKRHASVTFQNGRCASTIRRRGTQCPADWTISLRDDVSNNFMLS
jgi:hypothetical protein